MTKKDIKKIPKKDEMEDDIEDDVENDEADEEVEDTEFNDDEDSDDEKDELIIEPDLEGTGCGIDEAIENDDIYFNNNEETEIPSEQGSEYVSKENRISSNRLTKYEMVRILGERTKQLTMGAKPLVKNYQTLSYDKIAEEEFIKNMIPYKLKRPLPNGKYEIWTLDELSKEHLLSQLE
jgi:DNA-directed RNA polymerase subunit K/omega